MPLILAIAGLALATGVGSFLFYPQLTSSGEYLSRAQKISRLYNTLWDIEKIPFGNNPSFADAIRISLCTGYSTGATIIEHIKEDLLQKMYSPERLNDRKFIIVSYYLHGHWHKAIIQHSKFSSREILLATTVDDSGSEQDITQRIKEYAGHGGDFSNQPVTPQSLGYDQITLTILLDKGLKKIVRTYKAGDPLGGIMDDYCE